MVQDTQMAEAHKELEATKALEIPGEELKRAHVQDEEHVEGTPVTETVH